MEIKFKEDVDFQGQLYVKGEILKDITLDNIDSIWKLNEIGLIYPITYKSYIDKKRELKKVKEEK